MLFAGGQPHGLHLGGGHPGNACFVSDQQLIVEVEPGRILASAVAAPFASEAELIFAGLGNLDLTAPAGGEALAVDDFRDHILHVPTEIDLLLDSLRRREVSEVVAVE